MRAGMLVALVVGGVHLADAAQMAVSPDGSFSFEDMTVEEWLRAVNKDLVSYAPEFQDYGFGNVAILLQAEEEDLNEAFEELMVKKPHRRLILKAWQGLESFGEQHQRSAQAAPKAPSTPDASVAAQNDQESDKEDKQAIPPVDLTPRAPVHIITNAKKLVPDSQIIHGIDWSSVPEMAKWKRFTFSENWQGWKPKKGMVGVLVHRFKAGGEQLLKFGKNVMNTEDIHANIEKLPIHEVYYCIMKPSGAHRVIGDLAEAERFDATYHGVMLLGVFPSFIAREAKTFMQLSLRELNEVNFHPFPLLQLTLFDTGSTRVCVV
jgi:hypothetical protein